MDYVKLCLLRRSVKNFNDDVLWMQTFVLKYKSTSHIVQVFSFIVKVVVLTMTSL